MGSRDRPDPAGLQRGRDRRHLSLIGLLLLTGFVITALGALLAWLGVDLAGDGAGRRGRLGLPVYVIGVGLITIALGVLELGHRVVKGPQEPGKRARY